MKKSIGLGKCLPSPLNFQLSILQLCFPKTVQVAVFVDRNGFAIAYAHFGDGLVGEVNAGATILKLHIHKGDVVLGEHRMLGAAHLDAQTAVVDFLHYGEVFLYTCLYGSGDEFGHLLAAAEGYYAAIDSLNDYITTVVTFIKFRCHSFMIF